MVQHQHQTYTSARKPGYEVQSPKRPSAIKWDQRAQGAPAEEVIFSRQGPVGLSQYDVLADVKARGVDPGWSALAEPSGSQDAPQHGRSGQPGFDE